MKISDLIDDIEEIVLRLKEIDTDVLGKRATKNKNQIIDEFHEKILESIYDSNIVTKDSIDDCLRDILRDPSSKIDVFEEIGLEEMSTKEAYDIIQSGEYKSIVNDIYKKILDGQEASLLKMKEELPRFYEKYMETFE